MPASDSSALYSPITGYDLAAIMRNALADARALHAWQLRFATMPNGIKSKFKPQGWRRVIADALRNAWMAARAERGQHEWASTTAAQKHLIASLSTDGRLAA